jgi:seryl-tRNA synthetase
MPGKSPADVQPIDRLEEKVRQLVGMIDTLREERARAIDDVTRLTRELEASHGLLADAASASSELTTLRAERDLIRDRVAQMISQIDTLSL